MRRLGAPLASALGRAVPSLRLRVICATRVDLIRAPDDPPSTIPGRTPADATNDVALEFLRDCESATTLADVGDEELAALLCVRAGEQDGGTKLTGAEVMRNRLPDGDDEAWRVAALRRGEQTRMGGVSEHHARSHKKKGHAAGKATGDIAAVQAPAAVDERMSDWQVVLAREDASVATEERDEEWASMEAPALAYSRSAGAARAPKPDEGE